jgi:hypothetical protein
MVVAPGKYVAMRAKLPRDADSAGFYAENPDHAAPDLTPPKIRNKLEDSSLTTEQKKPRREPGLDFRGQQVVSLLALAMPDRGDYPATQIADHRHPLFMLQLLL